MGSNSQIIQKSQSSEFDLQKIFKKHEYQLEKKKQKIESER